MYAYTFAHTQAITHTTHTNKHAHMHTHTRKHSRTHTDTYTHTSLVLSRTHRIVVVVLTLWLFDDGNQAEKNRWSDLKMAVQSFLTVRSMVDVEDVVSIVTFNSRAIEVCKMQPLADCATELETMLGSPAGGTLFSPALKMAHTLIDQGLKSPSEVRRTHI